MTPALRATVERLLTVAKLVESPTPWKAGRQEDSSAWAVYNDDDCYVCTFEHAVFESEAAYIAEANPTTLTTVCEALLAMERERDEARGQASSLLTTLTAANDNGAIAIARAEAAEQQVADLRAQLNQCCLERAAAKASITQIEVWREADERRCLGRIGELDDRLTAERASAEQAEAKLWAMERGRDELSQLHMAAVTYSAQCQDRERVWRDKAKDYREQAEVFGPMLTQDLQMRLDLALELKAQAESDRAALAARVAAVEAALRDLYDVQNGPPLEKYRRDWEAAMDTAHDLLTPPAPDGGQA